MGATAAEPDKQQGLCRTGANTDPQPCLYLSSLARFQPEVLLHHLLKSLSNARGLGGTRQLLFLPQGVSQSHIKSFLFSYLGICHLPRQTLLQFAELRHIRSRGVIFHTLLLPLPEIRSVSKPYQQISLKFSPSSFSFLEAILVQFRRRGVM